MSQARKRRVEMNGHPPVSGDRIRLTGRLSGFSNGSPRNFLARDPQCDRIREMRSLRFIPAILLTASVLAGCASGTSYTKSDAPWATIQRVGVFPFEAPYEDRVRRQWYSSVFVTEMRRLRRFEIIELPAPLASVGNPDYASVAHKAEVDAYIVGNVEDLSEMFVDLRLIDAATGETLWSVRYNRGAGFELSIRYQTSQQQLQRIFRIISRKLVRTAGRRAK